MVANGSDDDKTKSFTALTAGVVVSHYKIVSKIGAGGMGEVYLAEDTELNRKVALKFLPQHLCQDDNCRARFKREAQAAAKLDHSNIVPVYEVGEFQGRPFFAMAHIEGKSLRAVIKEGKLTVSEAVNLTMQICEGLNDAHTAGVVHRDIKPGNIIIDRKNKARLVDFGLATVTGEKKLTKTGSTLGTVGYMSPEQVKGEKADHRSDLFSVGVVLYEMITGRTPFEDEHEAAIHYNIVNEQPEPMSRYKSGVSAELQQIIDKALAKDVSIRYQSAADMQVDLKRLKTDTTPQKKSKTVWWVSAAAVLIALIGYFLIDNLLLHKKASKEGWTNSVAVLIFRNLSGDPEQDYFCEGMTEEIIGRLTIIKSLKVPGTQSMLRFKDNDLDLTEIGKKLKVENILAGSVKKSGDSIRVRAELIRLGDGASIWADKYDRELTSTFAIQDDISRSIAHVLEATLVGSEMPFASRRGTDNIDAYNAYIKGRHFWRKRTKEGLESAIEYFEKAVELDSNYAAGWSGLSDGWSMLARKSYLNRITGYSKADTFSLKALELDPNLAEAQTSRGWVLYLQNKYNEAEERFLRAIDLNPGYPWAHQWYSHVLESIGKREQAIAQENNAYELDPLAPAILYAMAVMSRKYGSVDKAEEFFRSVLEIEPTHTRASYEIMMSYYNSGDSVRALETVDELIQRAPDDWRSYWNKAYLLEQLGRTSEAGQTYKKGIEVSPNLWGPYEKYGWFLVRISDLEKAKRQFQTAIELDPMHPSPYLAYGRVMIVSGRTAEADEYFKKAVDLDPYGARTCRHYGIYLETSVGKVHEAIEYYEMSVELNERYNWGFHSLGLAYEKIGEFDKALQAINRAIEIAPSNAEHFGGRGDLLLYSGQFDSSAADWRRYLELSTEQHVGLAKLGNIYMLKQQYSIADSIYGIITSLPDSSQRSWGRLYAVQPLIHQGKFQLATTRLKEGIRLDLVERVIWQPILQKYADLIVMYCLFLNEPELSITEIQSARAECEKSPSRCAGWETWFLSIEAEATAKAGRYEEGLTILSKAIDETDPNDADMLYTFNYHLSQIYLINGDFDASAKLLEKVVAHNPTFSNRLYLGVSYLGLGQVEEAVEVLEMTMARYDGNRLNSIAESVLGHYHMGQVYEAADRTAEAIEQYETFLDIWKNADEGLESVEDAKERLARLKKQI